MAKVLFISGSVGLGHVTRDIAIISELRKINRDLKVDWLAAHPASVALKQAGENLLPEADFYANDSTAAEQAAAGHSLNLLKYLTSASRHWKNNVELFRKTTSKASYDLIIGDETYELIVAFRKDPSLKKAPMVMIYDFIGLDVVSHNPLDWLGTYIWNRLWSEDYRKRRPPVFDLGLYVGKEEDVPDKSFGPLLPNRRDFAKKYLEFIGYVFPFDPSNYSDTVKLREKLKYGNGPLILCSVGGTSIGKDLLDLCAAAYPHMERQIPGLKMVIVCGPRIDASEFKIPLGVEIKGFVPCLYEHFAACDLAIVQGGATSTFEIAALGKPFIYFPVEGHFEQAQVAERLTRYGAGARMSCSRTTPADLAEKAVSTIGKKISYAKIPAVGAQKAANLIAHRFLGKMPPDSVVSAPGLAKLK